MHEAGGERVIRSLLLYSCKLSARAIIATLPVLVKKQAEEEIYKQYISESVQMLPQGKYFTKKYIEIIHPKPIDNRTPQEIVDDVIKKAGLEVI